MIQTPQPPDQDRIPLDNKGGDKYTADTCDSDEDNLFNDFSFPNFIGKKQHNIWKFH